jgi:hypothetical protein
LTASVSAVAELASSIARRSLSKGIVEFMVIENNLFSNQKKRVTFSIHVENVTLLYS